MTVARTRPTATITRVHTIRKTIYSNYPARSTKVNMIIPQMKILETVNPSSHQESNDDQATDENSNDESTVDQAMRSMKTDGSYRSMK